MKNNKNARLVAVIVAFAVILYGVVTNLQIIYVGLMRLWRVFSTVITAALLAFMLNVLMEPIEQRWLAFLRKRKWKHTAVLRRALAIILTYLIFLSIIALILFFLVPRLEGTVVSLAERFPGYVDSLIQWTEKTLGRFSFSVDSMPDFVIDWDKVTETFNSYLREGSAGIINAATGAATSLINGVMNIFISLVMSVYLLAQKERIGHFFSRVLNNFLSPDKVEKVEHFVWLCSFVFSNFFAHQMLECVILGGMCYLGMLLLRIPYALIISVVIGFTQLIPMVGPLIGELIGAFILLTVSPLTSLLFLIFILILQQVENTLVYPRIVGKSIGLPGILTFMTVIIGGKMGGLLGAFLGVPIVAVMYLILQEIMERKEKERGEANKKQPEKGPDQAVDRESVTSVFEGENIV